MFFDPAHPLRLARCASPAAIIDPSLSILPSGRVQYKNIRSSGFSCLQITDFT